MKNTFVLLLASGLLASTGCVVPFHGAPSSTGSQRSGLSSGTPRCHPSHYWDGSKCKHKGKGKGARKHDD